MNKFCYQETELNEAHRGSKKKEKQRSQTTVIKLFFGYYIRDLIQANL